MGYLKIVVKIPDTIYPELVADLQKVQLRDRAERVRVLAMLGLRDADTILPAQGLGSVPSSPFAENPTENQKGTTKKLIQRLSDSL